MGLEGRGRRVQTSGCAVRGIVRGLRRPEVGLAIAFNILEMGYMHTSAGTSSKANVNRFSSAALRALLKTTVSGLT